MKENNPLQAEMLNAIRDGGAWFSTRKDHYVKIGYNRTDNCYYARECNLKDGSLEGGAYSFGTDWFDISFHGIYIDIYADADTFRKWNVWYDAEKGTCFKEPAEVMEQAKRVVEFCREADAEALAGITGEYQISGTNFDKIIQL